MPGGDEAQGVGRYGSSPISAGSSRYRRISAARPACGEDATGCPRVGEQRRRREELVERTKTGGGEIVELMGTSSYYAAAAAILQMVEAIVRDKKRILPCAAFCQGEYGVDGIFVGVPCVLGAGGVERIIEVNLDDGERAAFAESAGHVRELVDVVRTLFPELA